MNKVCTLEKDGFDAYLDEETRIPRVTYPSHLTPEVTIGMYKWFGDLIDQHGLENLRGGIFDFRNVEKFHPNNFRTARAESRKINLKADLGKFPIAFLVQDMKQEQMLRVSMRLTQNPARLRILYSLESAIAFIKDWYKTLEKQEQEKQEKQT